MGMFEKISTERSMLGVSCPQTGKFSESMFPAVGSYYRWGKVGFTIPQSRGVKNAMKRTSYTNRMFKFHEGSIRSILVQACM